MVLGLTGTVVDRLRGGADPSDLGISGLADVGAFGFDDCDLACRTGSLGPGVSTGASGVRD